MYANYETIAESVARLSPFEGNTARAEIDYTLDEYRIYSYSVLIAVYSLKVGAGVLNARKYSQTTSRLQNIIRKAWASEPVREVVQTA